MADLESELAKLEAEIPDVARAAENLRNVKFEVLRYPICIHAPTGIQQTTFERLKDLIRRGGIEWHRAHNPEWRDKPWKDGISVDLDEDDVLTFIAAYIASHGGP